MPFNLKSIYGLSKPHFPVLFIMGPGTDPMSEFVKFSKEYNNLSDENVVKKSLGLEQTRTCENALTNARMKGQWIIFQNCHLSMPFLQVFETRIAETLAIAKGNENKKKKKEEEDEEEENENDKIRIDPKFRMWATTKPTEDFPSFIAMNSIKVVCETPQSIKSHLVKNYNLIEKNYFNDYDDEKMVWIKKLIYGTALMHSAFFHRTN
jgi:dynein heavy chain